MGIPVRAPCEPQLSSRGLARLRACLAALLALVLAACAARGPAVPYVPRPAPAPLPDARVATEVGRLLSSDPEASRQAMERLSRLDESGREALARHAARIPAERDPRWLFVLDENRLLEGLAPEAEVAYLLWKVERPEAFYVMKAQGRLLELATEAPDVLLDRLAQGGAGTEALAVALGLAGPPRAVPALLAGYRAARTRTERRVFAEALSSLAGPELGPRVDGTAAQLEADAAAIERWWNETHPDSADEEE